ncbi:MAG TPA: hypothetical protein DHM44_04245 [Flexistipes sinusarabici]|uniref:Lipoprotein n=1 Tax=Flexistipes sinusarabici TaxID=2352 RepID=A0A3D5QCI1_FLESI|nr:hypothetical protein [Flexistipes sinusarabici]
MKRFILALIIILFVYACGSVSDGESGSSFESVRLFVSGSNIEGGVYKADSVVQAYDNGTCANDSDNYTYTTDEVTVNVKSEALPNLPSDLELAEVEVYNIIVSFIPNDDISPEVPTKEYSKIYSIQPNSTMSIPVIIIDESDKSDSGSDWYYQKLDNDTKTESYNYIVNIKFKAEERWYGGTDSFSYKFNLTYSDLDDDCTK